MNLIACYQDYLFTRKNVASYPFEAIIDPTNTCNLSCPYCRTGAAVFGRGKTDLSLAEFKKIITDIGEYLYLISLFSHGEPFLCKDLIAMVSCASEKNIPSVVHTNLNIDMDIEFAKRIVNSGLKFLSISIDGATPEVYQQYRRGGNLDLVLHNIGLINKAKTLCGSKTPFLIWQFLLFRHSKREVAQAARLAKKMGLRFRVVLPNAPKEDQAYSGINKKTHRNGKRCRFPWTTLAIASDGSVVPCCQAYHREDDLAQLGSENFRSLWNNERFLALRNFFSRKKRLFGEDKNAICYWCPEDYFWKEADR